MKFSILVPVYNVEQYLEQCIQSVLNQTYQNFELILVDDGSADDSGRICDKFAELYPGKIFVVHKKNQGLISARRVGILKATGEFSVFVDSDDFIELNLLETLAGYLNRDNYIDMLLYSFQYYRNEKKEGRFRKVFTDGTIWDNENKKELYEKLIYSSDITSIWTKCIRTSVLKEDPTDYVQYYGKNMAEDLLQSLYPLTAARKVAYTEKMLYNYRINDESISRSFRPETIQSKNTIHVYEKILEYLSEWGMDDEEIREKLKARWFNDVMYMMTKYYEGASKKEERQKVVSFDWDTLLPKGSNDATNNYANVQYKKLYYLWKKREINAIDRYFLKKKCYQKIKSWKKVLRGWRTKKRSHF
ncbi:MAG: glycosyltransferase family 2 protein [Lachnospiraceae bacterium]|nr:glycosyltransferase family 2 protein [Lachnospiraceae bacterium]